MLRHFAETLITARPDGTLTKTTSGTDSALVLPVIAVVLLVTIFLIIIPLWKVYKKAGKPGWAAIIPVYSNWVLFEITGFPAWIALLTLIPFVNIVPGILTLVATVKLAQRFGKGIGFGIGMIVLPFIFLPILGYGKAQYQTNDGSTGASTSPQTVAGAPEGAFNPVQPAAESSVQPTVGAPEPSTTPAGPAPQGPAPTEETPTPAADETQPPQSPTPPAA